MSTKYPEGCALPVQQSPQLWSPQVSRTSVSIAVVRIVPKAAEEGDNVVALHPLQRLLLRSISKSTRVIASTVRTTFFCIRIGVIVGVALAASRIGHVPCPGGCCPSILAPTLCFGLRCRGIRFRSGRVPRLSARLALRPIGVGLHAPHATGTASIADEPSSPALSIP